MSHVAAILGPTAAGKSAVAMILAERWDAEILSVDSMQVYRGMDVGTAKPSPDEQARVRHHMIDVAEPDEAFSVAQFQEEGRAVLDGLYASGRRVLIVGGSGLHFRALVDPLEFPPSDPEVRRELDEEDPDVLVERLLTIDPGAGDHVALANPRRVLRALEVISLTGKTPSERALSPASRAVADYRPLRSFTGFGIDPGDELHDRIERRLEGMMANGFQEEVDALAGRFGPTAAQAVGYRELAMVTRGEWDAETAVRRTLDATTALARRQRTFHRRDPRIRWIGWQHDPAVTAAEITRLLEEAGWSS